MLKSVILWPCHWVVADKGLSTELRCNGDYRKMQSQQSQKKKNNQPKPKNKKKPQAKTPVQRTVNAPVSVGTVGRVRTPKYRMEKNGKVLVRHCELVGDVIGSTNFQVNSYSINAGLPNIFVWLSSIAGNYESYKFKKLRFRFESACSTSTSGYIYITVDFDAADGPALTEQAIANYEGVQYGNPWLRHIYACAPHNLSKRSTYYVRNSALAAGQDIILYDVGNLQIATVGNGGTPTLGKVWAEYDVELVTPQLTQNGIGRALSGKFVGTDDNVTVPVLTGNVPLLASVNAATLTLTCTLPFQGLLAITAVGTVMASPTVAGTGTIGLLEFLNSASSISRTLRVNLLPGQTITIDWDATTVTGYRLRFGQYLYDNN